jgi:hypothetical protein
MATAHCVLNFQIKFSSKRGPRKYFLYLHIPSGINLQYILVLKAKNSNASVEESADTVENVITNPLANPYLPFINRLFSLLNLSQVVAVAMHLVSNKFIWLE